MHYKQRNKLYTGLISYLNQKAKEMGYHVQTKFDKANMTFTISNTNKEGDIIYAKQFGYHKDSEKDALISRAYEEYFTDMFEYGLVMNDESFKTENK